MYFLKIRCINMMSIWQTTVTVACMLVLAALADDANPSTNGTTAAVSSATTSESNATTSSDWTTTHETTTGSPNITTDNTATTSSTPNVTTPSGNTTANSTIEPTTDGRNTTETLSPTNASTTATPQRKFDAGSFFGGFFVAVAIGVIGIGLWKLYWTRRKEQAYLVFDS